MSRLMKDWPMYIQINVRTLYLIHISIPILLGPPHRSLTLMSRLMRAWPTYIFHLPHPHQRHDSCTTCATWYPHPRSAGQTPQNHWGKPCCGGWG